MKKEIYDALIIGAGPAGSLAAERLAGAGARVALFDGRPPNEPKACGGGVTSKALRAWPFLAEAVGRMIDEVELYSPSGQGIRLRLAEPFAIYSRRALDSYLRARARKAGAEIFAARVSLVGDAGAKEGATNLDAKDKHWRVSERRSGAEWSGRVLVAADGANSPIAKRLAGAIPPAEMEVAFGYRAPLPRTGDAPTVIAFLPGWTGYAWAFPRLDHISFGIATAQDTFDHAALDRLLWDFMVDYFRQRIGESVTLWSATPRAEKSERNREIEEKLRAATERYAARIPGLAPQTWNNRRAAGANWALLGDAAGFADPVTGEGIYYALRSAELFAAAFLAGETAAYEERWRADFGRELRRAAQMRRKFYGQFWGAPFTERMIGFAGAHPGIRRTLCELIAGGQGYVNLKRTLARRAVWPL